MPIDLSTLAILAGLFLGSVVGDAVLFGNRLQVHITVPEKLVAAGFTQEAAEQLFLAEVSRVGQVPSIVHTPEADVNSRPSVLEALVKPLQLGDLVSSLQYQLGYDAVIIHCAVIDGAAGPGLQMVVVVSQPNEPPTNIKLAEADGDAAALVERGSRLALELVSPYRVALTDFWGGRHGVTAQLAHAKEVAEAAVNQPWDPARATERVMLRNLLGLTALRASDFATAATQFNLSDTIPGAEPAAHGTVALNRAFIAVAQRRPNDAVAQYKEGVRLSADVTLPGYAGDLALLGGLVAWSAGDTRQAELLVRRALEAEPHSEAAHAYLAQLLRAKGDTAGADAESAAAIDSRRFNVVVPALAQSDFWIDPVNGGITPRD
jgi:tetratricopeptide (TPR) repeat protein